MILIVCVDDHNGMMFNHRRQSQDRVLRADILELTDGKKLWMNAYSRKQFAESDAEKILVDETFLDAAGDGEFCFVETQPITAPEQIEALILYRWERIYPADLHFALPKQLRLVEQTKFQGYSHPELTEEIYTR